MMTLDEPQPAFFGTSRLQLLAIQAKNTEVGSPQRHRALTQLIKELWTQPTFGILRKSLRAKYSNLSNGLFEDLFNNALQETFIAISRYIDKFDSRCPLLPFVRKIISNKFSNVYKRHCNYGVTHILMFTGNDNLKLGQVISWDELDEFVQHDIMNKHFSSVSSVSSVSSKRKPIFNCNLLRELLIDDPDNKFQASVRGKPNITFQYIAIFFLEGKNVQQLTSELEVPYQTLNSFFKRNLKRLEPYFREKLQLSIC